MIIGKLFNVTERVKWIYRNKVKNNIADTDEIIQKKLYRNFKVGNEISKTEKIIVKQYGNLVITLDRSSNTIIDIWNVKGKCLRKINNTKKAYWNLILGLR